MAFRLGLALMLCVCAMSCGDGGGPGSPAQDPPEDVGEDGGTGPDAGEDVDSGVPDAPDASDDDGGDLPDADASAPTLCTVSEEVLEPHCVVCHNGSVQALDLRAAGLAERLLGTQSALYPGRTFIEPGDPSESFLHQKVVGTQGADGGGDMPPRTDIPEAAVATLSAWIESGASAECDATATEVELLSPTDRAVRASLALRGVRPTPEELAQADDLPGLVDAWLETDAFGETLKDMHDEALLLRVDEGRPSVSWKRPLPRTSPNQDEAWINDQIQEAPLTLIEYVVRNDRPYTEILTADYALGNETMEVVWGAGDEGMGPDPIGLDCEDDELPGHPGWKMCRWTESGRNGAGVLSSTFFYVRWRSTLANQHRARANAISRAFLCYDFLDQPVNLDEVDVDLADVEAVANAVRDHPGCASCHQSLDPIASFLYGFTPTFRPGRVEEYPVQMYNSRGAYRPGRELANLRTPALFGEDGETLADLGRLLTEHPDFASCTVRRMYSFLDQTSVEAVPDELVGAWAVEFVASGYDTKALLKSMVLHDAFHVSHAVSEAGADDIVGLKKVRPEQASRMVEAMTGFRWITEIDTGERRPYGTIDLLGDARFGYRVLAGGLDGTTVVLPNHNYNPPMAAMWRQYAGLAAQHVVSEDFARPAAERRLLGQVEPGTTDDAEVRAQIEALYWAVLAERPEAADVDAAKALFDTAADSGEPDGVTRAWTLLLSAFFQDVRFTHY